MSKSQETGDNSWFIDIDNINTDSWDLTANNPSHIDEIDSRTPKQIIAEIKELDTQASKSLKTIKELI